MDTIHALGLLIDTAELDWDSEWVYWTDRNVLHLRLLTPVCFLITPHIFVS